MRNVTNKKLGNDFESAFCEILFNEGFWTHNMAMNKSGQPADVIAVRNGKSYLIDCKVCSRGRFALSRMEENQDLSMDLWKLCGNGEGWFAIRVGEDISMIPHVAIKSLREQKSYLTELDVKEYGIPLERWLKKK
jgi:Holliday junction resolvase